MNLQTRLAVAALAATVASLGCQKADDDYAPAVKPKTFTFEGNVDKKYVGDWVAKDESSTLGMDQDGGLKIDTVTNSVSGKSVGHLSGKWLAEGKSLMLRYSVGSQPPTVLKYTASISGNEMILVQDGGSVKTVYKRK